MNSTWGDGAGALAGSSIADMIAQTASEVMVENYLPGYVYMDAYQLYYNPENKMYYYPQSGLFYDTTNSHYLCYNQITKTYEPYVEHASVKKPLWNKKRYKRRAIEVYGNKMISTMTQDNIDVIECVFDLVDRVSFLTGDDEEAQKRHEQKFLAKNTRYHDELDEYIGCKRQNRRMYTDSDGSEPETDDESDELARRRKEELESQNPPCIRLIELLNGFKFHIITIDGGTIGSARHCAVQLPEEGAIDDDHVRISYDFSGTAGVDGKVFWMQNLSRHAVLVNETVLTRKKSVELGHGDVLLIGNNRALIHIHKGMNTCHDCEPGILMKKGEEAATAQAKTSRRANTDASRREFLNSMKRKYGLESANHEYTDREYNDRAKTRRKLVGSEIDGVPSSKNKSGDGTYDNCAAVPVPGASTDTVELRMKRPKASDPITDSNKGFKLLKGMGWSEGKGLGKAEQGATETIATSLKADRTGLGHEVKKNEKAPPLTTKMRILEKTKSRFEDAERRAGR